MGTRIFSLLLLLASSAWASDPLYPIFVVQLWSTNATQITTAQNVISNRVNTAGRSNFLASVSQLESARETNGDTITLTSYLTFQANHTNEAFALWMYAKTNAWNPNLKFSIHYHL
jgi:hypothetical protein